jgi:2-alkyl-3-oxoalkanoate reductase
MSILLVGSTGFIGGNIHNALTSSSIHDVRVLVRNKKTYRTDHTTHVIYGDIRNSDAVRQACRGVETVIHSVNYIGPDAHLAWRVNVEGTQTLINACAQEGIKRILYLSTTAVYGSGSHQGVKEGELTTHPESPASATRLKAEEIVLDAGGTVIRPYLVYGYGDRWVVPGLVAMIRAFGGYPLGGAALASVIRVDQLATAISRLALTSISAIKGDILHACSSRPVSIAHILDRTRLDVGIDIPHSSINPKKNIDIATAAGFSPHQVDLVLNDHWYSSQQLEQYIGMSLEDTFTLDLRSIGWYQKYMYNTNSSQIS